MVATKQNSISPKKIPQRWRRLFKKLPGGYDPIATAEPGEWFDAAAADDAIQFFPDYLTFIKGNKAGEPFVLEPWQQAHIGCIFGWKKLNEKGKEIRRYKEVFIYIPKKNGKTNETAGIVLLVLYTDGEAGAECYSSAADREQASLVFSCAKEMVLRSPELSRFAEVYTKSIVVGSGSYKAISAEANTKHGYDSHLVINDEVHAHKTDELVEILEDSIAARSQPLILSLTTADYDRPSVCNRKLNYARKVRNNVIQDSSFLPVIYEIAIAENGEPVEDWEKESTWRRVNPNLGVSVSMDFLRKKYKAAKVDPVKEINFKRYFLNIITQNSVRSLPLPKWDACRMEIDPAELIGRPCIGGLDLSSTTDISSFGLLFPLEDGHFYFQDYHWVPNTNAHEKQKQDKVPYLTWSKQGHLNLTEGDVVDCNQIRRTITGQPEIPGDDSTPLADTYDILELAYDRMGATQLSLQLIDDGIEVVPFGQGYLSMSPACKFFKQLLLEGKIHHNGNPVLRWMFSNLVMDMDPAENLKPNKEKSGAKYGNRIDGIVTLIMALGRAMGSEELDPDYEFEGVVLI